MFGWKDGGCSGLADCEVCKARNVTYRFPIKNARTKARLLICRICRDSFYPKPGVLSIFAEVPAIMDHWGSNQTTGLWPIHVNI